MEALAFEVPEQEEIAVAQVAEVAEVVSFWTLYNKKEPLLFPRKHKSTYLQ